jgi:hypothetical protein
VGGPTHVPSLGIVIGASRGHEPLGQLIEVRNYRDGSWERVYQNGEEGWTVQASSPRRLRERQERYNGLLWGDNRHFYGAFNTTGAGYSFLRRFSMSNWERMSEYLDPQNRAQSVMRESIP